MHYSAPLKVGIEVGDRIIAEVGVSKVSGEDSVTPVRYDCGGYGIFYAKGTDAWPLYPEADAYHAIANADEMPTILSARPEFQDEAFLVVCPKKGGGTVIISFSKDTGNSIG